MYTNSQLSSIIKFGLRWIFLGFTSIDIVKFALPSIVLQTQKRDCNPNCHIWWKDFWILRFFIFQIFPSPEGRQPGGRFYWGKTLWGRTQRGLHRETAPRMKWFLIFSNLSFVQSTHCIVQLTVKYRFHKLSLTECRFWPEARTWPLSDSRNEIMAGCRKHFAEELRG